MDDRDKIDVTDTGVRHNHHTNKTKLIEEVISQLQREIEGPEVMGILEEITEGDTVRHRYQPKAARVSWTQRVLAWFRRS